MNCVTCFDSQMSKIGFIEKNWEHIRAPFTAEIELLPNCNLRCIHCYEESERQKHKKSMTNAEVKRVIDILAEHGLLECFFTGGEVLTRPDFEDIYVYTKRKGIFVSVLTNGTLINDRVIELWQEYPVEIVSLTMYGYSEKVYESITGVAGSYKMFRRAVDKLVANKIPFELKFIGMRQNYHELSQMRKFSMELGVGSITGFDIRPMNDGNSAPVKLRVTPEQVHDFHMTEPDLRDFWTNVALNEGEHRVSKKRAAGNLYPCSVGYHYVYITHDGRMQGCVKAVKPRYNLLEGNFEDGWKFLDEQVVSRKASANFPCLTCEKFYYCEQCTTAFDLESGDPEQPVDFYCQLGALRKNFIDSIRNRQSQ